MSISSEITRISGNVSDALTAIANKGVTVPSGSNSDDLATLIGLITGGGGTPAISIVDTTDSAGGTIRTVTALDISDTTATAADVLNSKYFYTAQGVKTQGTAQAGDDVLVVTLSWDDDYFDQDDGAWVPDATFAEIQAAYSAGKEITFQLDEVAILEDGFAADGAVDQFGTVIYYVYYYLDELTVDGYLYSSYGLTLDFREYFMPPPEGSITISQSGNTDVTAYATASVPVADVYCEIVGNGSFATENNQRKWKITPTNTVDVAGWIGQSISGVERTFNAVAANTTITPTTSSQTIGGANYMMEGSVTVAAMPSGTEGTPTATKGTVSNHAVTVTPSVTNSAGYISGGTHTGTGVSVSASELVSGNKEITANGTNIDVANYSTVSVAVPSGTSKNTQVVQSTTRTNSSTMTALSAELTVSKTGTYDIYYSATRTNTSSSYTWATQLYKDGTAQGTENTTWSNNVQNVHLTNQSLTANQKLRVYGRQTRGSSYYVCAPMLAIVEA